MIYIYIYIIYMHNIFNMQYIIYMYIPKYIRISICIYMYIPRYVLTMKYELVYVHLYFDIFPNKEFTAWITKLLVEFRFLLWYIYKHHLMHKLISEKSSHILKHCWNIWIIFHFCKFFFLFSTSSLSTSILYNL